MIAQFIEYGGETIGLCLVRQNRIQHPEISLEFPTEITRHAISRKESRRTYSRSARYRFNYLATLRTAADCTEFRLFLNGLKDQRVAVPLWNDVCRLNVAKNAGQTSLAIDDHPVRSGKEWIILSDDNATWEIVVASAVSENTLTLEAPGLTLNWPAGATAYPLLFGYIPPEERPQIASITPARATFTLNFKERSAYARRLNPFAVTINEVGLTVPDQATLPLWDIMHVYERPIDRTEVEVIYQQEGFTREEAVTAYDQFPARGDESRYVCRSRTEIAKLEKFFTDRRGNVTTFMKPSFRNDLVLAQDLAPTDTTIHIEPSQYSDDDRPGHPGDGYIALWDRGSDLLSNTVPVEPQFIETPAGTELTTLMPIAATHLKANTLISNLLLVRLVEAKMTWSYPTDKRAATTLKSLELPNEYTAPSDVLPESAFIFLISIETPDRQVLRITSYEDEIVLDNLPDDQAAEWEGTYIPVNVSYRSIRRGIDPSACKVSLKFGGDFEGNPLKQFFPFRLEGRIKAKVGEVDVVDLSHRVKVRQTGEITEPSPSLMEAEAKTFGRIWDEKTKVPQFILSAVDNFSLFHPLHELDEGAWRFGAEIISVDGSSIVCGPLAGHPDPTGQPDDYFANGRMYIGAGAGYESRASKASSVSAGELTLVLDHPISYGPGGPLNLWPGYDGTIDQLDERFGVRENHGGHPYVPDVPPNVRAVKQAAATGGKK